MPRARWRELNATQVVRECVNGEGFLSMGHPYGQKLIEVQAMLQIYRMIICVVAVYSGK
jgi:hypothetical protein